MHQIAKLTNPRRAALQSSEMLTSVLVHEIASPLSSIILMAQCELRSPNPRELPETLGLILREAQRVRSIIEGVQKSVRREASQKSVCNLNDIVRRAFDLAKGYDVHTDHVYLLELSDSLPFVSCNETGIEQVVVNLIRNAAEAGDSIARPVHICVRTLNVSQGVEIYISDDGPGISADQLNNIFKPFFSTKTEDPGLHGLGLSVCKRIMEDHRSKIVVKSVVGGGSIFTFQLREEPDVKIVSTTNKTALSVASPTPDPTRRATEGNYGQPIVYKMSHHRISQTKALSSACKSTARYSLWRRHTSSRGMAIAAFRLPSISARLKPEKKIIQDFSCFPHPEPYDVSTSGLVIETDRTTRTK